ncbi:ABC transporter substrate-binding protein [Streptosporangium sp. NPDC001559]|uniref:ABC transporter substrate-binding protein n=1 Tax=Streptosporangium sp. NPDC001559 TaxID=3366187 RepID=UPI0036ECC4FA
MKFKKTGVITVAGVMLLTSCSSEGGAPAKGTGDGSGSKVLVFGAAGAPSLFDPFYTSDGESARVNNQMFEGLLSLKPGTADPAPGLAVSWEQSKDGKQWTFQLREGVSFHDGTAFDAAAVCANFERWYRQPKIARTSAVSHTWVNDFGGFEGDKTPSLYAGCEAQDKSKVVLSLTNPSSKFPTILAHGTYAMSSPTAMEKYNANGVEAKGEGFAFPEYGRLHPTGTGPFTFASYDDSTGTVKLARNDKYWGEAPKIAGVEFRTIPDETARRQELEAGTIHAYDLPAPRDWQSLKDQGFQVVTRPPFNVMYLGLNATTVPELKDLRVRQAIAWAVNKQQIVDTLLPEGSETVTQFVPRSVEGYDDAVEGYPYNPDKARALLAEAGVPNLKIQLWYPTEVTRPYMPEPKRFFDLIKADLEAVGIQIEPVAKPWAGGYLSGREAGEAPVYLLGTTGHYNSAQNFLGILFGATDNAFDTGLLGFGQELVDDLKEADSEPDPQKRVGMYLEINRKMSKDWLPSIPIASSPSALVLHGSVRGIVTSPVGGEPLATATFGE